jgi:putative acetyltransferase
MIKLIRTNSTNLFYKTLVKLLDEELAIVDGADHAFYSQFNKSDEIRYVIVATQNDSPVGCGAIKEYNTKTMEIKRMFVVPAARNKGIASEILAGLEDWARELSCTKCVLETGKRQPDAIGLYMKNGYRQIPNYGQYTGVENSVCFSKELIKISEKSDK